MMNSGENDYYEVISDEETFDTVEGKISPIKDEAISLDFDDLPFVPKFSSEIRNTVESVKANENDSDKDPLVGDWGSNSVKAFSTGSTPLISCPYFPEQAITPAPIIKELDDGENHSIPRCPTSTAIVTPKNELCSKVGDSNNSVSLPSVSNVCGASGYDINAKGDLISAEELNSKSNVKEAAHPDWVDENGDPIQGAFDNIDTSAVLDSCVNVVNNTKVEYVFHVKERKNVITKSDSDVGSVSDGIPLGTVSSSTSIASNFVLNVNSLSGSNTHESSVSDAVEHFDEKRLYEASKNKHELCKISSENENIASVSDGGSSKDFFFKKKTEHTLFKRNDFIHQKKNETAVDEDVVGQNPVEPTASTSTSTSTDEKALESQALNELLREVKLGAERAKSYGALGWQKQPVPVVNKTFLKNTLVSTLRKPYKPPTRRGCHHEGLKKDKRDESTDSSSSSRSRSTSSSSYSSSSSHSSRSRSRSRDRKRSGRREKDKDGSGPWLGGPPPPPGAFYDWATMGQYSGYPCYNPEAMGMYYGMDGYPGMYYNDPEFWAAYCDFYGIGGGYSVGFRGRGMRGRGWRGRGRGGGGEGCDLSEDVFYSRQGSRSRSRSPFYNSKSKRRRSCSSRSISPDVSGRKSRSIERGNGSKSTKGGSMKRDRSEGSSQTSGLQKNQDGESKQKDLKELKSKKKKGDSGVSLDESGKNDKKKKKGKKLSRKNAAEVDPASGKGLGDEKDEVAGIQSEKEKSGVVQPKEAKKNHEEGDEIKSGKRNKKVKAGGKESQSKGKGKMKKSTSGSGAKVKGKKKKSEKDKESCDKEKGSQSDLQENGQRGEGFTKGGKKPLDSRELMGSNPVVQEMENERKSLQSKDETQGSIVLKENSSLGSEVCQDEAKERFVGEMQETHRMDRAKDQTSVSLKESVVEGRDNHTNISGFKSKRHKDDSEKRERGNEKSNKKRKHDEKRKCHRNEDGFHGGSDIDEYSKSKSSSDSGIKRGKIENRTEQNTNSGMRNTKKLNKLEEIEKRLRERKAKKILQDEADKCRENQEDKYINRINTSSSMVTEIGHKYSPKNEEIGIGQNENKTDECGRKVKTLKKKKKKKVSTKLINKDKLEKVPSGSGKKFKEGKKKNISIESKGGKIKKKKKVVSDKKNVERLKNEEDSHTQKQNEHFTQEISSIESRQECVDEKQMEVACSQGGLNK